MCRYSHALYKSHFACFDCRKVFRVRSTLEWANPEVRAGRKIGISLCPDCRKQMKNMGLDFKAPPKRNKKQWEKVKQLYAAGVKYFSCGCSGPGPRPETLREVPAFIAKLESSDQRIPGRVLLRKFERVAKSA